MMNDHGGTVAEPKALGKQAQPEWPLAGAGYFGKQEA